MSSGVGRAAWSIVAMAFAVVALSGCAQEQTIRSEASDRLDVEYDGGDSTSPHAAVCAELAVEAAGWSGRDGLVADVSDGGAGSGVFFDGVLRAGSGDAGYEWSCELRIADDGESLTATLTRFDPR